MSRAVGIDLGTTMSATAWVNDQGKTAILLNRDGESLTPSSVLFEDYEAIVGKEALKSLVLKGDRRAVCVKRDMGNSVYARPIRGKYLPPEVIQACILRKIKEDVSAKIGPDFECVITVPAFFDEARRKATADAGEMAGLRVLDIVNEPTAAALAFGEVHGFLSPSGARTEREVVLVYDLGGGTFDATLIEVQPGNIRTLATDGDVQLGGYDWDKCLANYAADEFMSHYREDPRSNPLNFERLMASAEEAKHTLSARQRATVTVIHAGRTHDVDVTREKFEELTAPLLERTSLVLKELLQAAGMQWSDVSRVLLVGGSSRMPMVPAMLKRITSVTVDQSIHPDEAVARGAALHAAYVIALRPGSHAPPRYNVTSVNAHSLGLEGIDVETLRKRNFIVLRRNTALPTRVSQDFMTKSQDQRSVVIHVLEGESSRIEDCSPIGRTVIRNLPPNLPMGATVRVTFEYLPNGRLTVHAEVPGTLGAADLTCERMLGFDTSRVASWKNVLMNGGRWNDIEQLSDRELAASQGAASSGLPVLEVAELVQPPQNRAMQPVLAPAGGGGGGGGGGYDTTLDHAQQVEEPEELDEEDDYEEYEDEEVLEEAEPGPDGAPTFRPIRRRKRKKIPLWANAVGFLLFSAMGLAIGYYILCWLRPESGNFLHLDLPGLPKP